VRGLCAFGRFANGLQTGDASSPVLAGGPWTYWPSPGLNDERAGCSRRVSLRTRVDDRSFRADEYLTAVDFHGREHHRLRDDWRDGAHAHRGVTVAGYPNLFLLYGPNTSGVSSIIFMHEAGRSTT
jgi:cation diffusion facilitator CzcD-associated flavoprotein CzcO